MELFKTEDYFIFVKGQYSLWWNRHTNALVPKTESTIPNAVCLGVCYGLVGKVYYPALFAPRLLIIKQCSPVGKIHGNNILYKIKSVVFLDFNLDVSELGLDQCLIHTSDLSYTNKGTNLFYIQKNSTISKTWDTLINAGKTIKTTTQQAAAIARTQTRKDCRDKEKFEKRIINEFYKIFCDTDSFYFCETFDITNSLQRICEIEKEKDLNKVPIWKLADDKFFWNKYMLHDLIDLNNPFSDPWIIPLIKGFAQIEDCKVPIDDNPLEVNYETLTLLLISRRSRYRAGTRYKRRGVDNDGECANYVETEQILNYHQHEMSFVQVRGSAPIYWSQPGFKYRPPPKIDKNKQDNQQAFVKHFTKEVAKYGPICIINLIEQTGRERVIWEAYTNCVLQHNSPDLIYCTFDFHEYCHGMHFENVLILVNALTDILVSMGFCWRDAKGNICSQKGTFRVNCIDCLDRTNVVQTALAKASLEMQFIKIGLMSPDGTIPDFLKKTFQILWANNGDVISKQYSGTNALKGDYTRTGERKFSGIMKDGMNSASRYYLSCFKDSLRQGIIDLMLGNCVSEEVFSDFKSQEEYNIIAAEHVKVLIEECKAVLVKNSEDVLGSWGLINITDTCDLNESEIDSILILTKNSYTVAEYDSEMDHIVNYETVPLKKIISLELGIPGNKTPLFKIHKNVYCICINYKKNDCNIYFHTFKATNLRFFNNMAVVVKTIEEELESLRFICEAFEVAIQLAGLPTVPVIQGRKIKINKNGATLKNNVYFNVMDSTPVSSSSSEDQFNMKNSGSKTLSNFSQQFKKIRLLGAPFLKSQKLFSMETSKTNNISNNTVFQKSAEKETEVSETRKGCEFLIQPFIPDMFLPNVGILMIFPKVGSNHDYHPESSTIQLNFKGVQNLPDIQINNKSIKGIVANHQSMSFLNKTHDKLFDKRELDLTSADLMTSEKEKRSNSERDLILNISQSRSESALRSRFQSLTSPVAVATKDLVLVPFTKLAKGVQSIGTNLDFRKVNMGSKEFSTKDIEENKKLYEKWKNCKTRLIAL